MTSLVITADTHLPKRARDLPPALWSAIDDADVVIHAGDWMEMSLLDVMVARAGSTHGRGARVVGVWGNNDGPDLRSRLPEVARFEREEVRFAVVHETGAAAGREQRMDAAYPHTDVLVFGHSHIPWDTRTPGGIRLLNPGSPTDRRRQPEATFMTARVQDGAIVDVALVPIDPSWREDLR